MPQRPHAAADRALAAIDLEIIRGKLEALAEEMGLVLARASMSPVIYEIQDFACGICDAEGQLIAQTNGITVLTGTLSGQVQAIRRRHGDSIRAGDIFISNDPYDGGTHTADVAVIKPVYADSELLAFVITTAHWSELGGMVAGSLSPQATEIYQEGLRLTGLRIYREGERQDDIFELIAQNVRLPGMTLGDLNAELAAVRIGDARLREIHGRHGAAALDAAFRHLLASGEAASRRAIAALPDGVYRARDWIDGDGRSDERIGVQVAVTIRGDAIRFDFTGSSPQRAAPINCTRSALHAAAKTVLKAILDPQAPSNDGWFRPMEVVAPPGTIFTAVKPAATGWCFEASAHATELVWKALATVVPDRLSAGSYLSLSVTYLGSVGDDAPLPFVLVEPNVGGWGASREADGASALIASPDGNTYNYSVELFEAKFPFRITQYALNIAGGTGHGRHRGGFGVVREYQAVADGSFLYANIGRSVERPWGLEGGTQGSVNGIEVTRANQAARGARQAYVTLGEGDRVRVTTGGGGGYGPAVERDAEHVRMDVRDGYITAAAAREIYGVCLRGTTVDVAATALLRAAMA